LDCVEENEENIIKREDENDSSNIFKKKKYFKDIKLSKIEVENKDRDFEKMKIEMIRANPIRKYTFERNTIQQYKIIDGKLVPFENNK
jgi:hypothetical protein